MAEKKMYNIGYTQGTFDLFHIGHLKLLENAQKQCRHLIVGVNSDRLVKEYKNKETNINETERAAIVGSIKGVEGVIITDTLDKLKIQEKTGFNVIFIGDDWKGNDRWEQTKKDLAERGVDVVFLPYTKSISTTKLCKQVYEKYKINFVKKKRYKISFFKKKK